VGLLAFHAAGTPAAAAPKRITGKLSKPDFTVLGLAKSGDSKSDRAGRGRFVLKPPAKIVTLHLRASDGTYAGPIVVDRDGRRRAIMGVKAGAKLGRVQVNGRKGFAKVSGELPEELLDEKRFARAKKGVPIGAGNFGRVRSSRTRGGAPGDRDLDGVPDTLDIDDDGDLVLDNVDTRPANQARVAQAESGFGIRSVLAAPFWDTTNANATALTTDDIDATLKTWGRLIFEILPGDSAELDCGGQADPNNPDGWSGGLSYCTRGGTGTVQSDPNAPPPDWPPFPGPAGGPFDPDGDGFGTLPNSTGSPAPSTHLAPGATSAQIGTGDVPIQVRQRVGENEVPALLPYVFATTPALVSYDDGQGNAATIRYPVTDPIPGPNPGPGGPGTDDNPFKVKAAPNGEVVVTLTFFRPQRRPIGSEAGEWTDIGGLTYSAGVGAQGCPQTAFSADPNAMAVPLTEVPYAPGAGGLIDRALDQPATGITLTYALNLTQCLRGDTWSPGEERSFNFGAVDSAEGNVSVTETVPGVTFELQP
jgi:hypothetical protein